MARRALLVFAALLTLFAIGPARAFLTEEREVLDATPSVPVGAVVPVELPAGSEACLGLVTFTPSSEVARFAASTAADGGPPLRVTAAGGEGSSYRATATVAGGWQGAPASFDVALTPPAEPTVGRFCVTNAGDAPATLVGSEQGRGFSRGDLTVDGAVVEGREVQLSLLEARPASLLARAGEVLDRAATFKPGGPWLLWLLLGAAVVGAPVALGAALRRSLRADGLAAVPEGSASGTAPWVGMWRATRERAEGVPTWAVVSGGVLLATAYLFHWGVDVKSFQDDEDYYLYLSRWLTAELPSSLWDFEVISRGLQRLEIWLLAVAGILPSPESIVAARALNGLAFASTAIPVWLLGRGLGLGRWWALLPALVSVLVPWSVVSTSFLTENLAYPTTMWAGWAIWRTATAPSLRHDVMALGFLLLAGMSRTAMLALGPALPAVVAVYEARRSPGSVAARVKAVLRAHPLVWAITLPAGLALVGAAAAVGPLKNLVGVYSTPVFPELAVWGDKLPQFLSRVVVGTGVLPFLLALPWLVRHLARHRDDASSAFALVAFFFTGAMAVVLYPAALDERYIVYLAPLVLLPATAALVRRELPPAGIAITGAGTAALIALVRWEDTGGPYGFFASSVEVFVARGIGERLGTMLPGGKDVAILLFAASVAVVGLALAAALRRAPNRLAGGPAVLLVGAVVAFVLIQTEYTMEKFVGGAGNGAGPPLSERAWIESAVPEGEQVAAFLTGQGNTQVAKPIWQEAQFYNPSLDAVFAYPASVDVEVPTGDAVYPSVNADEETGLLHAPEGQLPRNLVVSSLPGGPGLAGETIDAPSYLPLALVRLPEGPPALRFLPEGFDVEGWLPPGAEGRVRFFGRGVRSPTACALLAVSGATVGTQPVDYEIRRAGGDTVASGTLQPTETRLLRVPVPELAGREHVDLAVTGEGTHPTGGAVPAEGTVRLINAEVAERC